MSYEYEENEYEYEYEEYLEGVLTDEEVDEIQEEYRKKKLMESLMGPGISSAFHTLLIVILAFVLVDKVVEQPTELEVSFPDKPKEEIIPPKPKDIVKIEPDQVIPDPVMTQVKIVEDRDNSKALEDISDETPKTDDDLPHDTVLDVVAPPSAFASNLYGSRSKAGMTGALNDFGADKGVPVIIDISMQWLARVQNPDGSWGSDAKSAYTGLAVLTFLAQGETHLSKKYGATAKNAFKWLVNDPINTKSHHGYPHAVKTYALCEAFAMTGMYQLEEKMNKCVRILIDGQQDGGSYNYNYNRDQGRQDLSFSGWNFQALKAADIAGCEEAGLQDAIYKAKAWLKKCAASSKSFAYTTANNNPESTSGAGKWTMRSVGTLCLQLFNEGGDPNLKDELDKIVTEDFKNFNYNNAPKRSLYGWYYATNAMFQAQGDYWDRWKRKFQAELKSNQHKDGYWVYPGQNHIPGDDLSHKVYATTLNTLQLSVFFRYLPTSKIPAVSANRAKAAAKKKVKIEEEEGLDLVE